MAASVIDINKSTIMNMLRTDVFGFSPVDIENKAKEVYHLVGGKPSQPGSWLRDSKGFIQISLKSTFKSSGKKTKK